MYRRQLRFGSLVLRTKCDVLWPGLYNRQSRYLHQKFLLLVFTLE